MAGTNGTAEHEPQPEPYNAQKLKPALKRRRSRSPGNDTSHKRPHASPRPSDPNTPREDSRRDYASPRPSSSGQPTESTPRQNEPSSEPPRRKRPSGRAISEAEKERIRQRQLEREKELAAAAAASQNTIHHAVTQHYNAVPERGRDWRMTSSRIKGLRSFNNWVKSTLIQKFSPSEDYSPGASAQHPGEEDGLRFADGRSREYQAGLLVLDIGCGKGGDLGKWAQAPQRVELYVGLDPADVSIEQAKERYRQMARGGGGGRGGRGGRGGGYRDSRPPPFHGEFFVQDCFGESIEQVKIIREVGFDGSGGPSRFGGGRFDVVSMMFCLHYAFESEEKARRMLKNVAGALKKGGRLIGCIPNSDVLSRGVEDFNRRQREKQEKEEKEKGLAATDTENGAGAADTEPAKPSDNNDGGSSPPFAPATPPQMAPDSPPFSAATPPTTATAPPPPSTSSPSKPAPTTTTTTADNLLPSPNPQTAEWGNSIYRVRFPSSTPSDGIFRPPFGWKYSYFLHEAVEEVPEYVVPWEAFRAIAEDYNLEMRYCKGFHGIWESEGGRGETGRLAERMGVRDRRTGEVAVSGEEWEAVGFYLGFCFEKI
jgi:mRNA (guanine-N7-)-methyltransferase